MSHRLDETTGHAANPRNDQSTQLKDLQKLLADKRNVIMVVASLIATLSFQAAMNPPGGVWQDDSSQNFQGSPVPDPHMAGDAVMAYKHPFRYAVFYIANTVSFGASLTTIFLLLAALVSQNNIVSAFLTVTLILFMCFTIISVLVSVSVSIGAITPDNFGKEIYRRLDKASMVYCTLVIILIMSLLIILLSIVRQKLRNHTKGDQEAPQIQVDVNQANEEATEIQLT